MLLSVVSATGEGVAGACFESSVIPEYSLRHDDWWVEGLMEQVGHPIDTCSREDMSLSAEVHRPTSAMARLDINSGGSA
jgi:hypothetical protein